jgi:hypothetical protein
MSDRETASVFETVLEVVRPMYYGFMAVSPGLLFFGASDSSTRDWLPQAIGLLYGVTLIWCIVRYVNRRHDPRTAKRPTDRP